MDPICAFPGKDAFSVFFNRISFRIFCHFSCFPYETSRGHWGIALWSLHTYSVRIRGWAQCSLKRTEQLCPLWPSRVPWAGTFMLSQQVLPPRALLRGEACLHPPQCVVLAELQHQGSGRGWACTGWKPICVGSPYYGTGWRPWGCVHHGLVSPPPCAPLSLHSWGQALGTEGSPQHHFSLA